jgi:hypothetical protein
MDSIRIMRKLTSSNGSTVVPDTIDADGMELLNSPLTHNEIRRAVPGLSPDLGTVYFKKRN